MEEKKQEEYPELVSPAPVLKQWFIKSSSEKIQDHYTISEKDVHLDLLNFKKCSLFLNYLVFRTRNVWYSSQSSAFGHEPASGYQNHP